MHNEYLKKSNIQIIYNKLTDMLLNESSFEMEDVLIELTELYDLQGKQILRLDDNLHFNSESIQILETSVNEFKKDLIEFKKDFSELEVDYEKIEEKLNELVSFFYKDFKKREKENVRFITIPVGKDKTSLDCDLQGINAKVEFNGKQIQLNSPHDYEFKLSMPSAINGRKNVDVLLSELSTIEEVLSSDPCILHHTGRHRPFQSEEGSQVKRNTRACTRIQINQVDKNIIAIPGIYHKVGDVDQEVQNEYEKRKEALSHMKEDINYSIDECERLYNQFKLKLITAKYGKNVNQTMAMCRYIIAKETKGMTK